MALDHIVNFSSGVISDLQFIKSNDLTFLAEMRLEFIVAVV